MKTWHVVTSQGGIILGVYGSALLSMAQEQARKVERETGFSSWVDQVDGQRPNVGDRLKRRESVSERHQRRVQEMLEKMPDPIRKVFDR